MSALWTSFTGTETRQYNSLLQLTRATVPGIMDMEYLYTAGQNNGRIAQSKDWIGGEEVSYTYDSLQRLATAATTGPEWGEAYSYDGFGNLTGKTVTKGSAPSLTATYNPATNQPYNGNYDLNGNAPLGTWDIENRLVQQTLDGQAVTWAYDQDGKRVIRYEVVNGQPKWTFSYHGLEGQRMAQVTCKNWPYPTNFACLPEGASVYFGGKLIAETDGSGRVLAAPDRLGTVRGVNTNGTWAKPTYFPYGEPRTAGGIDVKQQFATYVRDSTASAQDYAGQRYYSNVTGRFWSPDHYRASASLSNPQTWNRYAYVHGDPVNFSDPGGMDEQCASTWCVTVTSTGEDETPGTPNGAPPGGSRLAFGSERAMLMPELSDGEGVGGVSVGGGAISISESRSRVEELLENDGCASAIGASSVDSAVNKAKNIDIVSGNIGLPYLTADAAGQIAPNQVGATYSSVGAPGWGIIRLNSAVNWSDPSSPWQK